jgi:hypothetical protein
MSAVDFLVVFAMSASAMAVLQYLKKMPRWSEKHYAHRCGVCGRWHYER